MLAAATLLTALGGVILAIRGQSVADKTHALVNGQSEQLNALREAKGRAEGVALSQAVNRGPAEHPAEEQT